MIATYAPYALALVLIAAMWIEMRTGRIPNWLTLVPFILFILVAATSADPMAYAYQLGLGIAMFALGILLFIFAGFGAGAVKLLAGVALFVPLERGGLALIVFFATFFVGTFLFIRLRKMIGREDHSWHVLANNVMPMSVAIAAGGLTALFWV